MNSLADAEVARLAMQASQLALQANQKLNRRLGQPVNFEPVEVQIGEGTGGESGREVGGKTDRKRDQGSGGREPPKQESQDKDELSSFMRPTLRSKLRGEHGDDTSTPGKTGTGTLRRTLDLRPKAHGAVGANECPSRKSATKGEDSTESGDAKTKGRGGVRERQQDRCTRVLGQM